MGANHEAVGVGQTCRKKGDRGRSRKSSWSRKSISPPSRGQKNATWLLVVKGKNMATIIKLTVNLSSEVVDDVRLLAKRRGCTMTEVIRDAIGSAKFIAE